MAIAPTLYAFDLQLNHTELGFDGRLDVRTARHPSETLERVWLRLLAYAWHYQERIAFGPGLSDPDAPDLLATDLVGETRLWVRCGKADPQKVQRAVFQNALAKVAVFFESMARAETFVSEARGLQRLDGVELVAIDPSLVSALAAKDERRVRLTITIAGDHFYVECGGANVDGAATRVTLS